MFDCATQGLKMYELVPLNKIFVQLFSSLLGFFFLVFSIRLSISLSNWFKNETSLEATSGAYSERRQASKMVEIFFV